MNENYKWFIGFWLTVAVTCLLVTCAIGGWLDWTGRSEGDTAAGTIVLALAAVASLVFVVKTAKIATDGLKDAERTRHGQLIVDISNKWDDPTVMDALERFGAVSNEDLIELVEVLYNTNSARSPTAEELKQWYVLTTVPDLIDTMGLLWSEDILREKVIWKGWGPVIISWWHGWQPAIEQLRKYDEEYAESSYTLFQRLAERMLEISAEVLGSAGSAPAGT